MVPGFPLGLGWPTAAGFGSAVPSCDGHHFALGDLGYGLDPLHETALNVAEVIMGRDTVGQLQKGLEPLLFTVAEVNPRVPTPRSIRRWVRLLPEPSLPLPSFVMMITIGSVMTQRSRRPWTNIGDALRQLIVQPGRQKHWQPMASMVMMQPTGVASTLVTWDEAHTLKRLGPTP